MGIMGELFIVWQNYIAGLGDEPCEWDHFVDCPNDHCAKCNRHFTDTNPQAKDDEMECFVCFEEERN